MLKFKQILRARISRTSKWFLSKIKTSFKKRPLCAYCLSMRSVNCLILSENSKMKWRICFIQHTSCKKTARNSPKQKSPRFNSGRLTTTSRFGWQFWPVCSAAALGAGITSSSSTHSFVSSSGQKISPRHMVKPWLDIWICQNKHFKSGSPLSNCSWIVNFMSWSPTKR